MSTNNSKLKAGSDVYVETDLENNLTCAITPNGLDPRSTDSRNIEVNYTLKLAWVIRAAVFGKTSNIANFNEWGLMKFNFAASRNPPKFPC